MGASAREIEPQIKETRERMDDNLTRLEGHAASNASRFGRVAAVAVGIAVAAFVGVLIYRRTRRPTLRERLRELSLDDLRAMGRRMRDAVPSVTVRVNEKTPDERSTAEAILREAAPALVGTAGSALVQRLITTLPDKRE